MQYQLQLHLHREEQYVHLQHYRPPHLTHLVSVQHNHMVCTVTVLVNLKLTKCVKKLLEATTLWGGCWKHAGALRHGSSKMESKFGLHSVVVVWKSVILLWITDGCCDQFTTPILFNHHNFSSNCKHRGSDKKNGKQSWLLIGSQNYHIPSLHT